MQAWRRWEYWGIVAVISAGPLLRFLWEWSGGWPGVAPFAPVNRSVWEQLKVIFWPILGWALVEQVFVRPKPPAFWPAKAAALYAAPLLAVIIHYSYRTLYGRPMLVLDLANFAFVIGAAQLLSFRLGADANLGRRFGRFGAPLAWASIAILALAFALGTYTPPMIHLFWDRVTGQYGIH